MSEKYLPAWIVVLSMCGVAWFSLHASPNSTNSKNSPDIAWRATLTSAAKKVCENNWAYPDKEEYQFTDMVGTDPPIQGHMPNTVHLHVICGKFHNIKVNGAFIQEQPDRADTKYDTSHDYVTITKSSK